MWVFLAVTGHSLSLMNSFFYSRQTDILAGMVWFKTLIKRRHSNVLMVVRQDIFHRHIPHIPLLSKCGDPFKCCTQSGGRRRFIHTF